ncbi:hypothetical protein F4781DRAFT_437551 [Annulohypoxylon bovei var. microspora]|nr:hypothetical protein F4781DRAFT_437551 [Annulohypoxylon bovei var. microspora]
MEDLRLLNPLSKANDIKQLSGFPKLKPAYILKINLGNVLTVGNIASGEKLLHVDTGTGSLTTAEGYEHQVTGEVIYGADWMFNDPDEQHARPNTKILIKTDDGVILSSEYTGVAIFSEPIRKMWAGDPSIKTFPFGISTTTHTFSTGDPKYKHLEKKTFVGNGRFVINENPRSITVESRISEVVASNDLE